jgi:hypothetical protein
VCPYPPNRHRHQSEYLMLISRERRSAQPKYTYIGSKYCIRLFHFQNSQPHKITREKENSLPRYAVKLRMKTLNHVLLTYFSALKQLPRSAFCSCVDLP